MGCAAQLKHLDVHVQDALAVAVPRSVDELPHDAGRVPLAVAGVAGEEVDEVAALAQLCGWAVGRLGGWAVGRFAYGRLGGSIAGQLAVHSYGGRARRQAHGQSTRHPTPSDYLPPTSDIIG